MLAHQDRIYSIALRMLGDPRDAEEAAQDALVRAYRALAGYDARAHPWRCACGRGWPRSCSTCAARVCLVGRRPPGRRSRSISRCRASWSHGSTKARGPAAVDRHRAAARDWADLLLTLPPAYRSAVVLRHVDGLSYPELAIALDRPEGTVKAQVHRGLALLRTAFEAAQRHEREEMTA